MVNKGKTIIIEKEDMNGLKEGSKLVLLKWGVFEITKVDEENKKYSIKYLPED